MLFRKSKLEKFFDELNKKLFPDGEKQHKEEAQEIMKLSNGKLNFDESLNLLLGTSALFNIAEDKSENRMIKYMNKKVNQKLNNEEAKVILNFIISKFYKEGVEKVKASREQFAEVLYCQLQKTITKKSIKSFNVDSDSIIKSEEDFNKMFEEFIVFYMWLIVYICEGALEDENKRDECLDIFHWLVYKRNITGKEEDFRNWWESLGVKYTEYNNAMETVHPSRLPVVLAKIISKNVFGKVKESITILAIVSYLLHSLKLLTGLIKKFEID